MSQRIIYIDQLKGLAILLVVMGHVCSKSFLIDDTEFNYFYSSFHMPLFMFLSGLFAYKGIAYWDTTEFLMFLRKKSLRILIPFIVWGGCLSLFTHRTLTDIYTGIDPSLWFLPALFYCMIWGFVTYKIVSLIKIGKPICINILVNIILYISLFACYKSFLNSIPFLLSSIKLYPFFIVGTWISKYDIIKKLFINSEITYFVSLAIYILCWVYKDTIPLQIRFTGFFAIIVLMNYFKSNDKSIPSVLTIIGKYSLEIYLFHWFLLPSLHFMSDWYYSLHLDNDITQNFIFLAISSFAISIPIIFLSVLFSKIIQKNKYVRIIGFGNLAGT